MKARSGKCISPVVLRAASAATRVPRAERAASGASRERSEPRARAASEASFERSEPRAERAASGASRERGELRAELELHREVLSTFCVSERALFLRIPVQKSSRLAKF